MSDILGKLQSWGLVLLVFLLPIFFLPTTVDFFDFNKQALLVFGGVGLAVVWALRNLLTGKLVFFTTPLDLPVIAVAAIFVLSAFLQTLNKMDAFLVPGAATTILGATLLYFLVVQIIGEKRQEVSNKLLYAFLFSGLVVSLVSIAASTGLLEQISQLPPFMKQKLFSLVGAPLPTITFLVVLLPLLGNRVFSAWRGKQPLLITYHLSLITLFTLAIIAIGTQIAPGKPVAPRILPVSSGWAIAVETLKQSPLGMGPGNFVAAFNQYRPLSYNQTDLWNLRFAASSNWYLQVFTEVGIVGLLVFLLLAWRIVKLRINNEEFTIKIIRYTLYAILLLFLLLPANFILLIAFYLLLGLVGASVSREAKLRVIAGELGRENERILPGVVLVVLGAVLVAVGIFGSRAYAAEATYKRALDAAARNDGTALYNLLIAAINLNPRVDRYRMSYSQTNLALANSIAQKQDITDQDRQTITQLVQQSIREAQAGVGLNNQVAGNWANLASIYQTLIPFAQGADQWAVSAYSQAIALDPINPLLRINLGGVHYGAGRFDEAIKVFELAVAAKPDFANARYNLAVALREKGNIERAVAEMEQVLNLVDPGTQDFETAQKELANLRGKLPKPTTGSGLPAQAGETLQAPQPAPAPAIKPPLELPQEAAPPAPEGQK